MEEETPADAHALGIEACLRGDLAAARIRFEQAARRRPKSAATLCNLAGVLGSLGEFARAAEIYERVLELRPDLEEAYAGLAWVLPMAGADGRMAEMVHRWLQVAPADPVARHLGASLGLRTASPRCEAEYIEHFFDGFAASYDEVLDALGYRAPDQIGALLCQSHGAPDGRLDIIDAGCGTGLCGLRLRPHARTLVGLDLSHEMLARARHREVYDELIHTDLVDGLTRRRCTADVVVAADVLVYFGDLREPFEAARRALRPGGWILASVERFGDDDGARLASTGRYEHGEAFVRAALVEAGLVPEHAASMHLRSNRGRPVPGLIFSARKPA
jgi:predicted TPR repeat methyltransferase